MTIPTIAEHSPGPKPAEPDQSGLPRRAYDALAVAAYALAAVYVTARLWADPGGRTSVNARDQTLFEWMLAHAARSVTHLENPFFTDRLGAPDGVNVMANTSMLGLAVPLTPVTLLWGPGVTYVLILTLGFAGTAAAWYFVLSRHLVASRLAAFVGGAFCGFAPGIVSQAVGHPHMQAQFLVPLIIWQVFRLRSTTRPVIDGLVLGLLVAYQFFIGEEVLFITALVCLVCVSSYALARRDEAAERAGRFLAASGVAVAVAVAVLAYPIYWQFFGTGSYGPLAWIPNFYADLASFPAYSSLSLAGGGWTGVRPEFAQNTSEQNAFFGWPLLLLAVVLVGWLRRQLAVWIAAVVAVLFAALSLGSEITYAGTPTGIPGPWRALAEIRPFDAVVTSRFALVTTAAIGVLLALGADRALREGRRVLDLPLAGLVGAPLLAIALVPLAPRPLPVIEASPVPQFFATGEWREYVDGDRTVMVLPPVRESQVTAMRWAASQRLDFRIVGGYFLGPRPGGPEEGGTLTRPLSPPGRLIAAAEVEGAPPAVSDADRALMRAELRRGEVAVMVLPVDARNVDAVRTTVDALVGPGQRALDVWLWDVRRL